jgi:signal transduction histidine kinase
MTVRLKLALTIFITGALTALGVVATVLFAFQRFEHETTYYRANAFLGRVVAMYDNMFELHERHPEEFTGFLRNLVLFEPDTQLYLLDAQGTVLAFTGEAQLPAGFKVDLKPVLQAVGQTPMPYVMGDDPERMDADAVIAAKVVKRPVIRNDEPVAGYLYLVAHQRTSPQDRWQVVGSSFAKPALAAIVAVVLLSSLLAWWVIATVTRPLRRLSDAVAAVSREGLGSGAADPSAVALPNERAGDEFGQLATGFRAMLGTLRQQWEALRRLDHFRREGVSNLSHDLRSPLTATAACLETLETRWAADPARADDQRLVEVALRNTRNAARLVQSLGDLAQLDEPAFKLQAEVLDAGELLDDIAVRFGERAAKRGVSITALQHAPPDADSASDAGNAKHEPPFVALDIELFERAIANLVDNALKFSRPGDRIELAAQVDAAGDRVVVSVADTGPGIPAADVPHLFDRFYQSRQSVAPATGEGGKGLGLAIVKRIAELHGGDVAVTSAPGAGTQVALSLPRAIV